MEIENSQKEIEKFNKIFDEGESFEKAVKNLPKDSHLIGGEITRLMRNIENYKKAVSALENVRKSREGYLSQELEESDRRRKIFHDGIISAIKKNSRTLSGQFLFSKIVSIGQR